MDYLDTRSSSRAQLKRKGKYRGHNWLRDKNKSHRAEGGKGFKAGRCNAGGALRIDIGVDRGRHEDEDEVAIIGKRAKVDDSTAGRRFVEEYERETERYLRLGLSVGMDIWWVERLDWGERFEGSSVCDSVEGWLSGMEEGFEMLDLSSSFSSAGSISEDGWAVVPGGG
jgi:hypothetical protein